MGDTTPGVTARLVSRAGGGALGGTRGGIAMGGAGGDGGAGDGGAGDGGAGSGGAGSGGSNPPPIVPRAGRTFGPASIVQR